MSERDLNRRLCTDLKRLGLDPQRVENAANDGCPDIEFVGGWIESKFLRRWPSKSATIVKLDHFTTKQRAWHVRRHAAQGLSWVVLDVAGEILVFEGAVAAQHLGYQHRDGLTRLAALHLIPYDHSEYTIGEWFADQISDWYLDRAMA